MKDVIIFLIVVIILVFVGFEFVPYFVEAYQDEIVYQSINGGKTWQEIFKSRYLNILSISLDPKDSDRIYLGTQKKGVYKSYSQGKFWHSITQEDLPDNLKVQQILIDPNNANQIYLLTSQNKQGKIFKTQDQGKTWQLAYVSEQELSYLALDSYQPSILYLAGSQGDLFKSSDYGASWRLLDRFKKEIVSLAINPKNTRILYLALENGQIYKSLNKGENWFLLSNLSKQFKGVREINQLVLNPDYSNELYLASEKGLFNSWDKGETWHKMNLIMEKEESVSVLAVREKEIFYGSGSLVYNTSNQGNDWQVGEISSDREISSIVFDPNNSKIIYLTTKD